MKMEPDLLMTLADPGIKPDRDPLLGLGQHLHGKYLLLETPLGPARPSPELVLLPRSPPGPLILPGDGDQPSLALEQVLGGMEMVEEGSTDHQTFFPEGSLEYLYGMEEELGGLADQPVNGGEGPPGVEDHQDCCNQPSLDVDLRLVPVENESLASQLSSEPKAEEEQVSSEESLDPQDLPLVVREDVEELSQEETFSQTLEEPLLQTQDDLILDTAPSPKETLLDGLPLDSPWTQEMEGSQPPNCQERRKKRRRRSGSPSLPRPLDYLPGPAQLGTVVDLFPACPPANSLGPPLLEFGQVDPTTEDEGSHASPEEVPRLRAVFEALDRDGDGFVRIEEFIQFATVYGAEQVKDLTGFLDPAGLGVISFEDFYRGISAIRNGADPDNQLCAMGYDAQDEAPSTCPDEFDDFVAFEANEVTDSAYMGSESTYSECETFTDEDTSTLVHHEMHDEIETDSAIDSTVHSEFTDPIEEPENGSHSHDLSLTSDINSHSIVTVITGEEHFEDYGEGNEGDIFSDSLCNGESGFSSSSFLSPSTNPLAAKLHSIITDDAFEFYCTQCHKQINRLEDLSARLNDLEMNSPNKRLSSKKVARHLHQTGALTVDAMEEPFQNNTQCLEEDITDKVIFLEKRVTELEKDTAANGEQHNRLKQENLQLVHRANALEEQLKEQELKSDEVLMEEIRKQRELLSKMEREKSIEIENLQARLQQLDDENGELRSCVPCLKANIERLEEEKRKLLDEIEDLTLQLNEEQENKRKLGDKLNQERHQFQKDKESTQELIEDLRKQLEHLQLFKLEAEQRRGRSSSIGLQEYNSRTRETELEQEIRRLKQDNRNLKEQNDELNGQIINLSIQGAKNLFSASFSESLAAEISSVSRDELMEAIQKQEEINFRLQDYIDRIIVAIMETNPSILEVK
ncbi:rab11 family-interacting protein 3 isoform X2 [Sceloporus undulatus]|nr:rab11 family-interacting protein 3 isoform X2 [Sceloporus undulatus]XP_042293429.1 rab11 family-interacting protein 3 isoform X2 [Sceloporus undulatus]